MDAVATLNVDGVEDATKVEVFAWVNPKDMAALRKALKDDLKYVESFVRTGYLGTVAGVNLYSKKDATLGTVLGGTRGAVTVFNKKGTEVEQERDADHRKNDIFSRKYYIVALTDETKAVKIHKGTAKVSTDTTVSTGKTYYAQVGNGYVAVVPNEDQSGEGAQNPKTLGWYEIA